MKVCIAQTRPVKGNVSANITAHKKLIALAVTNGAEAIFFPELSITGYEPELAKDLAIHKDDERLDEFQHLSDTNGITIGIGVPTISENGIQISMIVFQPYRQRQAYSKQQLHSDEFPYFVEGKEQLIFTIDNNKIAPAICYESLQSAHAEKAFRLGAQIYVASVAKSQKGVDKAITYYEEVAKKYSIPVLMANCVGVCDNFQSAGNTLICNKEGKLLAHLDGANEGLLIFDTDTEKVIEKAKL